MPWFAIVGGTAFLGIFLWGACVALLRRMGGLRDPAWFEPTVKIGVFALFCVFGFCAVPLVLQLFVVLQERIGNGAASYIRTIRDHLGVITLAVWSVFAIGLCLGIFAAGRKFFGLPPGP